MKKQLWFLNLVICVALLFQFACGSSSDPSDKTKEFTANNITVAVPENWTSEYGAAEQQILITTPDGEFAIGIQILDTGGSPSKDFSNIMSSSLDGTTPKETSRYGDYEFDAVIMELPTHITILTKNDFTLVLVEVGDHNKYAAQTKAIVTSLKSSNANFQAVIDAIKK